MKRWFGPLNNAWVAFATHKLRSVLTILGVVIGVGAVIALMSIGKGTEASMLSNLSSLGTDLMFIQPGFTTSGGGVRTSFGSANTLTLEDAQAISENVPDVAAVAPYNNSGFQIVAGSQNMFVRVTGATPEYQQVYDLSLTDGDFFSQYQYEKGMRVAVLGPTIKEELFGEDEAVGQSFRLGSTKLTVIGVLESKGASMMGSTDDTVLVPLATQQGMMARSLTASGKHIVNSITIKASDEKQISSIKAEISYLLRERHNIALGADDDFTVNTMDELSSTISSSMNEVTLLLGAIAGISLLVGGIGVMNIMLVSVMERRREIGVRKALGAKERDIWGQFLLDSALLTFTGGIIGVLVGWGISRLLPRFVSLHTLVSPDIVVLAVSVSVAIGLFFGFYPAWQASRMDPIEALRSE
jgi:putative ABC transport system permease protein